MLEMFRSHWFNKRTSALAGETVRAEQLARFNALYGCDPDRIAAAVTAFACGRLGQIARIIEEFERRDDKMATCSMKMRASVGRCDYQVLVKEGFERDPRAARHAEILKRFWSTVRVTDRFRQNEVGGMRLLRKQMMDAQSYGFAVHEIVWRPLADGSLAAEFIRMPLWHFENTTGALRFLADANASEGVPMAPGEWLVTTGDGVGIAASIVAMAKRLCFQDWLLFSERSGMPIIIGKTGAAFGSDQWNRLRGLVSAIYRDTRALVDRDTTIEAIGTGSAANLPFPQLIDWADRAIAALYRGADLSTVSKGEGTGASLQGDESAMLEQDAVANLGEALHEQVDRFVIRYATGDDEPLAYITVEPIVKPDVDTDIKIDAHLAGLGVRLSRRDALQRYGRIEAEDDADALEPVRQEAQPPAGAPGLANEGHDGKGGQLASTIEGLIADEMARAIADELKKDDEENGSGMANAGHPYTKCPGCGKFMSPNGACSNCDFVEDDDRLIERGKRALERATTGEPTDVTDAMYRKGIGSIDFVQGWEGKGKSMEHGAGLKKIQQKHGTEMAQIPETIIRGRITPLTVKGTNAIDKDGIAIVNGTNIAILSRSKGDHWRLITHYKSAADAKKITEAAKHATSA